MSVIEALPRRRSTAKSLSMRYVSLLVAMERKSYEITMDRLSQHPWYRPTSFPRPQTGAWLSVSNRRDDSAPLRPFPGRATRDDDRRHQPRSNGHFLSVS